METLTIDFKYPKDKVTIEKILQILEMEVTIHENNSLVPEEHYRELDKDFNDYKNGELTMHSWEKAKKEILSGNDL